MSSGPSADRAGVVGARGREQAGGHPADQTPATAQPEAAHVAGHRTGRGRRAAGRNSSTAATVTRFARPSGSIAFQARFMSWSNRNRGQLQRTSMKNRITPRILAETHAEADDRPEPGRLVVEPVTPHRCQPPRNMITIKNAAVTMCRNSATSNSRSLMPAYSVW